jgi:UDP-glucose 4-epimerase
VRVLVTGGGGVIGAEVVRRLLARGDEPVVVSRSGGPGLLGAVASEVELAAADIRDRERMAALLGERPVEVVIHLAAALPRDAAADPVATAEVNVLASAALFELADQAGARRFVFASSKSAYGPLPEREPVREDHPSRPYEPYGATKLAAEIVLAGQARRPGTPELTSLRFASIYGPGKADRHAAAALTSRLIADALAGRPVHIDRGGDQIDDLIYVGDVADAVVATTTAAGPLSPLYNVSTGVAITLRDFAAAVAAAIPGAEIEVGPGHQYMGPDFVYGVLDPSLAAAELGFRAGRDPAAGVRRFAAAVAKA